MIYKMIYIIEEFNTIIYKYYRYYEQSASTSIRV